MIRLKQRLKRSWKIIFHIVPIIAIGLSGDPTAAQAACGTATDRPKIGLVLSGGGALGASHVGVLKVLEDMKIPIDCITGTSMGAIVGGLYASGMDSKDLTRVVSDIDWGEIFQDRPPRENRDFRRKLEDEGSLFPFRIGVSLDRPSLPRGLILGQKLSLELRSLTLESVSTNHFDDLAIPFRAIAADIETGKAVILEKGDLVTAMRASMAVSGLFPPVEIEGRLLVDGGLANNLPMDIARQMGADALIIVDIPTQLKKREDLGSAADILAQSISIMVMRSSQQQLATINAQDILIQPDLADFDATAFDRIAAMIPLGAIAAERVRGDLQSLSQPPALYQTHFEARPGLKKLPQRLAFVRLDNRSEIADAVIWSKLTLKAGDPFDIETLEREIATVYGLDYFETVTYRIAEENGEVGIIITATEKTVGLHTLRAGLALQYDLAHGANFSLISQLRLANLTEWGGEALFDASLGQKSTLQASYLQPLDVGSRHYLATSLEFADEEVSHYEGNQRLREIQSKSYTGSVALLKQLSNWGLATMAFDYGWGRQKVRSGTELDDESNYQIARALGEFRYDTIDDLYFPTKGQEARIRYLHNLTDLGAETQEKQLSGATSAVQSWGRNSVRLHTEGGTTFDQATTTRNLFALGGLFRLSGYGEEEVTGKHYGFGSLIAYRDVGEETPFFDLPLNLGVSLETAMMWTQADHKGAQLWSGSVFAGADTPLGPLYMGYGMGGIDRHAFYLTLGGRF